MQPKDINLVIVDDHQLILDALFYTLERRGFNVIAKSHSGREGLHLLEIHKPDILLLDLAIPDISGQEILSSIKNSKLSTRVLVVSSSKDPTEIARAIRNGAAGYISKDLPPQELAEAIIQIANGNDVFNHELLDRVMSMDVKQASVNEHGLIDPLTEQELRVLMLISSGISNSEAASILSVSTNTIKTHVRNIFQKLGVSDRTSAALWASRNSLLPSTAHLYSESS